MDKGRQLLLCLDCNHDISHMCYINNVIDTIIDCFSEDEINCAFNELIREDEFSVFTLYEYCVDNKLDDLLKDTKDYILLYNYTDYYTGEIKRIVSEEDLKLYPDLQQKVNDFLKNFNDKIKK